MQLKMSSMIISSCWLSEYLVESVSFIFENL